LVSVLLFVSESWLQLGQSFPRFCGCRGEFCSIQPPGAVASADWFAAHFIYSSLPVGLQVTVGLGTLAWHIIEQLPTTAELNTNCHCGWGLFVFKLVVQFWQAIWGVSPSTSWTPPPGFGVKTACAGLLKPSAKNRATKRRKEFPTRFQGVSPCDILFFPELYRRFGIQLWLR
jgi:hypothetical protein